MPRFANMPIHTVSMGLAAAVTSATFGFGSGAGEYHFGMLHSPLGGASMVSDPAGRLVISNIGSSGQDGVSVAITDPAPAGGKSPGWAGVLDFGQAGALPPGSRVEVSACDQAGAKLASLTVTGSPGGHSAIGFSSAYCPSCPVTVELRLHGSVVQSSEFMPPLPPVLAMGDIGSQGSDGVEVSLRQKKWLTSNFRFELGMRLPAITPVALMGGGGGQPPVECDELRVSLNGLPPGTRYIGNLSVTASNTPVIVVSSEGLVLHDGVHVAQGVAHVRGVGDSDGDGLADIVCDNLGTSGQDGVTIKRNLIADTSPSVTGEMFSVDEDTHRPPWIKFVANARSQPGALPESHALVLTSLGVGSSLTSLEIDKCAPCGPYVTVVEAIRSGVVVDSVTHAAPPSSLATCTFGSSGGGGGGGSGGSVGSLTAYRQELLQDTGSLTQSMVMECRSPEAGPCTLTGSALGTVTADRVRVRCIPADGTIEPIESVSLLGNDGPPLLIKNMRTRINQLENILHVLGFAARAVGDTTITPLPDGSLFVRDVLDDDDDGDGVEIDIGDYPGAAVSIDLGGGGGGGAGGFLQLEYRAKQGSTGKTKFYDDETDGAGGPNLIGYENDECPTCPVTVELLNGTTVVASQTYSPPLPPALVSVSFRFQKIEWKYAPQEERIGYPGTTSMSLTNGATADATCVRIRPEGLPAGPLADPVSSVVVTASVGKTFTITNSGGVASGALGVVKRQSNGQLAGKKRAASPGTTGPDCAMVVTGIGSSGQDGVMFVGEDEDCDGHSDLCDDIDASLAFAMIPPTSNVAIKSKGLCCPNLLGASSFETQCVVTGTPASQDVTVDFSQVGSTSCSVEVRNNGVSQGIVTGVVGPLAARAIVGPGHVLQNVTASRRSSGTSNLVWSPRSNLRWSGPVLFMVTGGTALMGDELVITAENPTQPFAGIESMSLTGSNLPDDRLVILDYAITPTPINDCPADINGDHTVNVADLLSVISSWGACPAPPTACPADTNGDHSVNVADLLAVISSWGACP